MFSLFLQDAYYRFNDVSYRWIAKSNWEYSTSFRVSDSLYAQKEKWLVFQGLDTFASVSLNGVLLGKTNNQFLSYVSKVLLPYFTFIVSLIYVTLKDHVFLFV